MTEERRLVSREDIEAAVDVANSALDDEWTTSELADLIYTALPQPATEPALDVEAITGTLLHRAWLKSGRPDPLLDADAWDGFALTVQALAEVEGLAAQPSAEVERLRAAHLAASMSDAFTYEDRDNSIPTLPFADDFEAFWEPFAAKVAARLAAQPSAEVERLRAALTVLRGMSHDLAAAVLAGVQPEDISDPDWEAANDDFRVALAGSGLGDDHAA